MQAQLPLKAPVPLLAEKQQLARKAREPTAPEKERQATVLMAPQKLQWVPLA